VHLNFQLQQRKEHGFRAATLHMLCPWSLLTYHLRYRESWLHTQLHLAKCVLMYLQLFTHQKEEKRKSLSHILAACVKVPGFGLLPGLAAGRALCSGLGAEHPPAASFGRGLLALRCFLQRASIAAVLKHFLPFAACFSPPLHSTVPAATRGCRRMGWMQGKPG